MSPARQMNSRKMAAKEPITTRLVVWLQRDFTVGRIIRHDFPELVQGMPADACKIPLRSLCSIRPGGADDQFQVESRDEKRSSDTRFSPN